MPLAITNPLTDTQNAIRLLQRILPKEHNLIIYGQEDLVQFQSYTLRTQDAATQIRDAALIHKTIEYKPSI